MRLAKTALVVLTAATLVGGCKKDDKKKPANDPAAPTAGKTTTSETPPVTKKKEWTGADSAEAYAACWKSFNANDVAGFVGCFAPDGEFGYVDFAPPMHADKPEAITGMINMWRGKFADAKVEPQLVLANGKRVAAISLVTQSSEGKSFSVFEAHAYDFNDDGKVKSGQHVMDQATGAHQMGMQKSDMSPDSETAWGEKAVVVAKNEDKETKNLEFIKSLEKLAKAKDKAGMLAVVADDIEFRYVGDKNVMANKADYEKGLDRWLGMVETTNREVKDVWAAGDWVYMASDVTVKMLQDMPKAKGTKGKEVKTHQVEFLMVADGKVKKHWVFENTMQFPIQMGLLDPSKMHPPKPGTGDKPAK